MSQEENHKSWLEGLRGSPKYSRVEDDDDNDDDNDDNDVDYVESDNTKGVKTKDSGIHLPSFFGHKDEEPKEEPPIDPYLIHPPFTSLMRRINREPQSRSQYICNKLTIVLTLVAYLFGFGALILYTDGVFKHSPTLGYVFTMVPVLLHTLGVGMSVLLKVYYDLSDSVGHLEYMAIIIRSRLWLFPGVIGELPVSYRSDLEAQRKKEIAAMAKEKKATAHRFAMVRYLKRCQFPEFRVLFRGFESLPWSTVPSLPDRSLANAITEIAQEDIMDAFPVLDFLRVTSSLPSLANPVNWLRLSKRLVHFFCCQGGRVMEIPKFPHLITRAEDIEIDDVCKDSDKMGFERAEAMPWGSLRLKDSGARFNRLYRQVTTVAFVVFSLSLIGYGSMIFGELAFYSRLDKVFERNDAIGFLRDMGGNFTAADLSDEEIDSWINDYGALHQWSLHARLYLIFLIPLAIQASALLAECVVTPLLVIGTLIAHIDNFTLEVDQYMAILAVNHGSLAHSAHQISKDLNFPLEKRKRAKKVAMARDMAFSWRMRNFFKEVKFDSEVINGSVGIMILNFICHLVPLNLFIMSPDSTCVPLWMVLFFLMLTITLYYIISGGIECNNLIDGGIDSLLHSWQLKFMMVGWSGGFLQEHDGDVEVDDESDPHEIMAFVSKDPNETIHTRDESFDTILAELDATQRISSITSVLAHYEAEVSTPFSVLGVALTQEIITLVAGFFGGSIAGIIMGIIDDKEFFRYTLTCHGFL